MIVPGEKYLLAMLNSKVADFYIRNLGVTRNGGYFEYKPMFVQEFPAIKARGKQKEKLEALVDKIMEADNSTYKQQYEDEIDSIVFAMYEFANDEIEFVNGVL